MYELLLWLTVLRILSLPTSSVYTPIELMQEDKEEENLLDRFSPVKTKSPRRSARSANIHSSLVTASYKDDSLHSTTILGQ